MTDVGTPLETIRASIFNGHRVYDGACIWCGLGFEPAAQDTCDGRLAKQRLEAARRNLHDWERERARVTGRGQEAPDG